jgi:hypothetical protein
MNSNCQQSFTVPEPSREFGYRLGEEMSRQNVRWHSEPDPQYLIRRSAIALVIVVIWWSALAVAQDASQSANSTKPFSIRATHLLWFENTPSNANGTLSIQDDDLQFQKNGKPAARVKISAVQNVFLGEQDTQVGGLPMTLGKTAAPFGGGRVVSLFAHKKYDTCAVEYVDGNGGLHGAIFQVNKGQAEVLRNDLIARGAHVSQPNVEPAKRTSAEVHDEVK